MQWRLVTQMGQTVAILRDPEIYANRKEEIVTRMFGVIDPDHPYIKHIYSGGDYLIGGEIELLDRIRYNDGLDKVRIVYLLSCRVYAMATYSMCIAYSLTHSLTFSKHLQWRKTVKELVDEFESKGADTVYAFQTRNPTHAGHAYLMRSAGEDLRAKGFKKPVLWLSPLGRMDKVR